MQKLLDTQLLQSGLRSYMTLFVSVPRVDDVAVAVDEVTERHPAGSIIQMRDFYRGIGRVKYAWELHAVFAHHLDGYVLVIGEIEAEDNEALLLVLLVEFLETPYLLAAGGSAGAPDVKPHDLATVLGQPNPFPVC